MILAIDVYYKDNIAKAVGLLFNWNDSSPQSIIVEYLYGIEEYVPGEFCKRELPCLFKVIEYADLEKVESIVIDGYVYIDNDMNFGLGGRLYEALGRKTPIIGVAKTSFLRNKNTVIEIKRGESNNPLFVSSIGIDLNIAAVMVEQMKGKYRIPDLLKFLDRKTKESRHIDNGKNHSYKAKK